TLLVAAEIEVSAAVRAVWLDDADPAVAVAEGEQVLSQDLDLLGRPVALGQFLRQQCRHPEAAQQLAHRRASAAAGQELVVGLAQHAPFRPTLLPSPKLAPDRQ